MSCLLSLQHAVLLFTQAICSFIPDTPGSVRLQVQRESLLQRENLFSEQKRQIKDEKSEARGRWRAAGEGVAVVRLAYTQYFLIGTAFNFGYCPNLHTQTDILINGLISPQ